MPTRNSGSSNSLQSERFTEQNLNDLANGFFGIPRLAKIPNIETERPDLAPKLSNLGEVDKTATAAANKWRENPTDSNRSELDRSIDRMITAVANFEKALAELKNPDKNSLKSDLGRLSPAEASTLTLSNSRGMTGDQIEAAQRAAYGPNGYTHQLHDTGYRTKYPDAYGQTFDSHLIGENNGKTVQRLASQALKELAKQSASTMTNQQVEKFVDDYVSKASKGRFKTVKWNSKSYPD